MQFFNLVLGLLLLMTLGGGIWRAVVGPSAADRMLSVQVFGTAAVAVLLLLAQAFGQAALRDVALVFALLAAVTAVAFVRRAWTEEVDGDAE